MTDMTADEVEPQATPSGRFRMPGRRGIVFAGAGLAAVLVLGIGLWFSGLFGGSGDQATAPPRPAVFYDLPEMLVNLSSTGKQASYLKLRVALELDDPNAVGRIEHLMPRVVDNFQVYLRELRMEDLNGSAGLYRLREELLLRVNLAVEPVSVVDVLFKEMLVQ